MPTPPKHVAKLGSQVQEPFSQKYFRLLLSLITRFIKSVSRLRPGFFEIVLCRFYCLQVGVHPVFPTLDEEAIPRNASTIADVRRKADVQEDEIRFFATGQTDGIRRYRR